MSQYRLFKKKLYDNAVEIKEEFDHFISQTPTPIGNKTALAWWLSDAQRSMYPHLSRMAIDIFSIPPMSAEPERVFSGARRTISWQRARLGATMVEMTECLKSWIRGGITDGEFTTEEELDEAVKFLEELETEARRSSRSNTPDPEQ